MEDSHAVTHTDTDRQRPGLPRLSGEICMTVGQSHIVGTWTLNLSFSKGPLSSSRQVSPASLLIRLSVSPPPIFFFSFSSPQPLSLSSLSIYLSSPWYPDPVISMARVGISNSVMAPSFVFPRNTKMVSSSPPSLPPPFWNSLTCPLLHTQCLVSIYLTALLFMPACRIEPCMPWPLLFFDPISSKLTTTSGRIHHLSINGEFKEQKQRWQATLWLLHAGVWCCGWNLASSYQQSLHKLVHSGPLQIKQCLHCCFFFTNYR